MDLELTSEQREKIRLLSDDEMYRDAIAFAEKQEKIITYRQFGHQIQGLQEYARSFKELAAFVKHQRRRDWAGKSQSFEAFYTALHEYLNQLRGAVQEKYGFVPDDLTHNETREQTEFFAGLLAHEFIQHLAAEMMWQAWQKEDK
jgi:hypothetical protein